MSQALPNFDLKNVGVGQGGSVDLSNVMGGGGINTTPGQNLPTVRIHNDSGSGLLVTLPKSGQSFNLPAGGWQDCNPSAGESKIAFTVLYVLPNPPVTLFMSTYYGPGEPVPPMTILGNSPVGVGGTVNTSNTGANTVTNTASVPGTQWLDIQPTDSANPTFLADNAGNITVKGDNAGVLTTLLQLIAGASPAVKIAAASIIAEVLGGLKVDGTFESVGAATLDSTLTVTGDATLNGAGTGLAVANNATVGGTLNVTGILTATAAGSKVDQANSATSATTATSATSATTASTANALNGGVNLPGGQLGVAIANDAFDASGADTFVKARGASNQVQFQVNGVTMGAINNSTGGTPSGHGAGGSLAVDKVWFNIGAIKDLNKGNFSASGTYNHGLSGTPIIVLLCPSLSGSTWTFSAYTFTSTQFSATINTAANTNWFAYR